VPLVENPQPSENKVSLRIALSGSSGMIGTALKASLLGAGHQVYPLVRRSPRLESPEIFWDPSRGELDRNALESMDAVVHLAGESIAGGRWTASRKAEILKSRVESTRFLSETLASLRHPAKALLVSSAIGFYGNRMEENLSEESPAGKGFLSEVCQAWEAASEAAGKAGVRVVQVRTGIVLSSSGGALPKMLTPFRLGLGGKMGTGKQWMSFISLTDLVGTYRFLLTAEKLSGAVNATAPNPVTNREFTKILGKVLKRPTLLPLPARAVKLLFGEMGEALLLEGQRVLPAKLEKAGFKFQTPDLESALRRELNRTH